MSATKLEREGAQFTRDKIDRRATAGGHRVTWKLAPNSTRKGHAYYLIGTCKNCAGNALAYSAASSCSAAVDIRHDRCPSLPPVTESIRGFHAAAAASRAAGQPSGSHLAPGGRLVTVDHGPEEETFPVSISVATRTDGGWQTVSSEEAEARSYSRPDIAALARRIANHHADIRVTRVRVIVHGVNNPARACVVASPPAWYARKVLAEAS